jgi:hypothetical protein
MNFPQTPKNPEIPARKLDSRENAGKILLEWTGRGPPGIFPDRSEPTADFRRQSGPDTLSKKKPSRYTSLGKRASAS